MHDPIAAWLAHRPLVILDGALATELEKRGANLKDPLWSAKLLIEAPDLIRAVHLDYFLAGADVATTATYQASFEAFAARGIDASGAARLMREAVGLASSARDAFWTDAAARTGRARPLVAASIGPYGAMLGDGAEYRGGYAADDAALAAFHRPRLEVLADSGADLFACETIPSAREALVLARLMADFPRMSAWISFSCRDGAHTCEGQRVDVAVAALNEFPQIVAVGVNCSAPGYVASVLERMRAATIKPLLAYPNSGERYDAGAKCWLGDATTTSFAAAAQIWYTAGARLIGGCCRTGPDDIRAIRASAAGAFGRAAAR